MIRGATGQVVSLTVDSVCCWWKLGAAWTGAGTRSV